MPVIVSQQLDAPAPGEGHVFAQSASDAHVGAHVWPEPVLVVALVVVVVVVVPTVVDVVFVAVVVPPPPAPPTFCVSLPEAQAASRAGTMKARVMKMLARFTGM
jgi:hypothetical protein